MPYTRPDRHPRRQRRCRGHRLPAAGRAPHRTAPPVMEGQGLRSALLTRLAGIGTLRDRGGLLLLTSHDPGATGAAATAWSPRRPVSAPTRAAATCGPGP